MGGDDRAVLYDAVGQIWLEFYGEHVHVGKSQQHLAQSSTDASRPVCSHSALPRSNTFPFVSNHVFSSS